MGERPAHRDHGSGRGGTPAAPREAKTDAASSPAADDALDPMHRHHAALMPPETVGGWSVAPLAPRVDVAPNAGGDVHAHVSMEQLLSSLVRRIAWSGDGRRGTVRIELGAGPLAGGVLVVHADEGRVRVQLTAPHGVNADAWVDRVRARLAARNIDVEHVGVT